MIQVNSQSQYNFEEVCIGTWTDGKPLYRKMVNFGQMPNNDGKTINPLIPNIKSAHINLGESVWFGGTSVYTFIHPDIVNIFWTGVEINIRSNANLSSYTAIVCLEYTKTTD